MPHRVMKPLELHASHKQTIETVVTKMCKKHKVKGAIVTISGKEQTLFSMHYGVIDEAKTPNHENAMMMIGSTTKLLTGMTILALCDEGKMRLDDAIEKHLLDLQIPNKSGDIDVTVEDLLMHAGGLASDDMDLITNANKTLHDAVDALNKTVRRVPPKTMYSYSNLSYALLGLIIESVSGKSYEEAIQNIVLDPLGLDMVIAKDDTVLNVNKKRFSTAFDKKGKPAKELLTTMTASGSGTYATSEDTATLIRFFLQDNPKSVLHPETFQTMRTRPNAPHVDETEMTSGQSMRHGYHHFHSDACNPVIGHGGATVYHHSTFDIAPKHGFGISIMTNSQNGAIMVRKLSVRLLVECFQALGIEPRKKPSKLNIAPIPNVKLMARDYVAPGLLIRHRVKNDTLFAKIAIFKAECLMQADGFYALKPRGIARLPLIRKLFTNIRLKQTQKGDEDVLMLEQSTAYRKMQLAFASPLTTAKVPIAWQNAVGKYAIMNDNPSLKKAIKAVSIAVKKDTLSLSMRVLDTQSKVILEPLNDTEAITQGFGRNARETVTLKHLDTSTTVIFQGIMMKKIA